VPTIIPEAAPTEEFP